MTVESPSSNLQPSGARAPRGSSGAALERLVSPDEYCALLLSREPLRREFARQEVLVDPRRNIRYRLAREFDRTTDTTPAP